MSETGIVPINGAAREVTGWTPDRINLIRRTVAKDSTDDEFAMFLARAQTTRLDPMARQIHFVKRGGVGVIQVGIDGYRLIADRTGLYAGNDEPIFVEDEKGLPTKATITVWKFVGGVRCAFTAAARWSEYVPEGNQGFLWKKMPHTLLGKCAEALALRKAFPQELSGMYTDEEMHQADSPETATNTTARVLPSTARVLPAATSAPAKPVPVRTRESLLASWDKLFTEAKDAGVLHGLSIDPTDQLDEMAATCQKLYVLLATEKRRQAAANKPTPAVAQAPVDEAPDDEFNYESPLA